LITAFALVSGVLVIAAFCFQQYVTYRSESQTLGSAIHWIDHQLRRAQAVGRLGTLGQAVEGVETKLSQQRLQVPATLDEEGFLSHFSAMAGRFDVQVKASQTEFLSLDFYDQAILRLRLAGEEGNITALLETLGAGKRLARHKVLHCTSNECDVEISIFSIPEPEEEPADVLDMQACGEFNSKVWLWPLRGRIQDRKEALKKLCEERQRQGSAIESTQRLMEKLRLSQFIGEVIKHLAASETPRQAE
jgi:hypothetical protein